MTVSELIAELQKMPPGAEVWVNASEGSEPVRWLDASESPARCWLNCEDDGPQPTVKA